MPTPPVTPTWIGNFIPTRTPTPLVSPLLFPEAPGAGAVTVAAQAAALSGLGYAIVGGVLLVLAVFIWCSLRAAQRAERDRRAAEHRQ